jgi:hypothetical protein
VIECVRQEMPPQPWPPGAGRQVATKLHLQPKLVTQAIDELIKREVFKMQVDGELYVKDTSHGVSAEVK